MAKSSGKATGDLLGIGKAASATAKMTSEIKVKEFDNRIKRKQFERDIKIKRIQADVDVTKIRQNQFTKRHKTLNESIQTFRNTADEIVNSLDKPFMRIDFTTKQNKKIQIELSPLSFSLFNYTVLGPIYEFLKQTTDVNDPVWQLFYEYGIRNSHTWEWFKEIVTNNPDAFQKSVAAGVYYTPPEDPDANTDNGSGSRGDDTVNDSDIIVPDESFIENPKRYSELFQEQIQADRSRPRTPSVPGAMLQRAGKEFQKQIKKRVAEQQVDTEPVFE